MKRYDASRYNRFVKRSALLAFVALLAPEAAALLVRAALASGVRRALPIAA